MTRTLIIHIRCACGTAYVADGDVGEELRALGATGSVDHAPPVEAAAAPHALEAGWHRCADGEGGWDWTCPRHSPAQATAPAAAPVVRLKQP